MLKIGKQNLILIAGLVVVAVLALVVLNIANPAASMAVAQNISPAAYQEQFLVANAPHVLIDVRTPEEFASGHIHGAVNIPVETLGSRLNEVSREQPVVVYCRSGNRSAAAAEILREAGYTNIHDLGGISAWAAAGYPVE